MKDTKRKKLVLTDGTWYFNHSSGMNSYFTKSPSEALNFHFEDYPALNTKERLEWEIKNWTNSEPKAIDNNGNDNSANIDRSKFSLKWLTIIESFHESDFNYEGFV